METRESPVSARKVVTGVVSETENQDGEGGHQKICINGDFSDESEIMQKE